MSTKQFAALQGMFVSLVIVLTLLRGSQAAPCSVDRISSVQILTQFIYYFQETSTDAFYAVSLDEDNYPTCYPGFGSDGSPVCLKRKPQTFYFFQIPTPIQLGSGVDLDAPSDCTSSSVIYSDGASFSVEFICNASHTAFPLLTNPTLGTEFEIQHACACDGAPANCGSQLPPLISADEAEHQDDVNNFDDLVETTNDIEFIAAGVSYFLLILIEVVSYLRQRLPIKWVQLVSMRGSKLQLILWLINPFVWSFGWFSFLTPTHFLQPTRDWYIDACACGFVVGSLYESIVNPGKQKLGAAQLTAVLQLLVFVPIFSAQASSAPALGAIVGFLFSLLLFIDFLIITIYSGKLDPTDAIAQIPVLICIFTVAMMYVNRVWKFRRMTQLETSDRDFSPYIKSILNREKEKKRMKLEEKRKQLELEELKKQKKKPVPEKKAPLMQRLRDYFNKPADPSVLPLPVRLKAILVIDFVVVWALFFTFAGNMPSIGDTLEDQLSGGKCCHYDPCFADYNEQQFVRYGALVDIGGGCKSTHGPIREAWVICTIIFGAISSLIVLHNCNSFVAAFREDRANVLRGRWNLVTNLKPMPTVALINILRLLGSQVVFLIFGWIITTVLMMIVFIFIAVTCVIPGMGVWNDWFWKPIFVKYLLWNNGPTIITTALALVISTNIVVRFGFQSQGNHIGIKNQSFYSNFDLFSFMINLVAGIFSAVKRLIFAIIFGSAVISRVDKALTPRGFQNFDPAFSSYTGFLLVESFYSNPVILTFLHLLSQNRAIRREYQACGALCCDPYSEDFEVKSAGDTEMQNMQKYSHRRSITVRNRWALAYTLLKNPSLIQARKGFLIEEDVDLMLAKQRGFIV